MTFLHSEFLYFMLPLLVLLFSLLLTQDELTEQIFSAEALKKLYVDADQFSVKTRNIFYLLMFFFLILALSSPVIERGHAITTVKNDTFYIVLESSQKDFKKAQKTAKDVLAQLSGAQVGLLQCGTSCFLISPPTEDYELLEQYIVTLELQSMGITSYEALVSSVDLLVDDAKDKQIVVISDINLTKLQTLAKEKNIQLFDTSSAYFIGDKCIEKPIYFYLFIIPISLALIMLLIATSSFHRGESHYVPTLILFMLVSSHLEPLQAELLSYKILEGAQGAYEVGDYKQSAKMFKRYGMKMESEEAIYNAANSYYKLKQYQKALELYRAIHFVSAEKNYMLYHNLGATLVALKREEHLYKAIQMYKKALSYKEVPETRENLEWTQVYVKTLGRDVRHGVTRSSKHVYQVEAKVQQNQKKVEVPLNKAHARYYKIELQK